MHIVLVRLSWLCSDTGRFDLSEGAAVRPPIWLLPEMISPAEAPVLPKVNRRLRLPGARRAGRPLLKRHASAVVSMPKPPLRPDSADTGFVPGPRYNPKRGYAMPCGLHVQLGTPSACPLSLPAQSRDSVRRAVTHRCRRSAFWQSPRRSGAGAAVQGSASPFGGRRPFTELNGTIPRRGD